ncbi:hypothetical protein HPP92_015865 [Vanilla planifolia]|uniref:Uncharacterized protein n=1 Tax=Vanilla planifolia TaxID=51239 RepID=A0A835UU32_VANPL|nr:hypothetical protein HPP92_015865 [Vanilla planifolia]
MVYLLMGAKQPLKPYLNPKSCVISTRVPAKLLENVDSLIKVLLNDAEGRTEVLRMPDRTRPMTAMLVFLGVNAILVSTINPVYDFVCFLPFWERMQSLEDKVLNGLGEDKV